MKPPKLLWTHVGVFYIIRYAQKFLPFYDRSVDRTDNLRLRSAENDRPK
jgi:hypothetical protein